MKRAEKKVKKIFTKILSAMIKSGPSELPAYAEMKTILVLRPDRLGDMILSVPAVSLLRKSFKGRIVVAAGNIDRRALSLFFPGTEIIVCDKKNIISALFFLLKLATGKFSAVVDLHSYPFSVTTAVYSLISGAEYRVGFSQAGKIKNGPALKIFSAGVLLDDDNLHESEKNLILMERLGVQRNNKAERESLNISIPEEATVFAYRFYDTLGVKNSDTVIGIHPTLKKADNRWSMGRYFDFLRKAKEKFSAKIIVLHGRGEEKEIKEFREMIKGENGVFIAPQLDLVNMMAVASRFSAFVCNDSGIMHLVSLVAKTVAIFGPTDPQRWGPIGNNSRIVLRSPGLKCDLIEVDSVLEAADTVLKKG